MGGCTTQARHSAPGDDDLEIVAGDDHRLVAGTIVLSDQRQQITFEGCSSVGRERGQFTSDALAGCEQLPLACLDDVDEVAADLAWKAGLVACLVSGLIEFFGAFVA